MIRSLAVLLLLATPALAQSGPNASFNLVNHGGKAIKELYATSAGQQNFGLNRLKAPLAAEARLPVLLPPNGTCVYDIRAVFVDGTKQDLRAVNTCKTDDVVIGSAKAPDDADFRLVNRGKQAITELTATPPGQTRGASLVDAPILAGGSRDVHVPKGRGCSFDLRLVLGDGSAKEKKGADLCKMSELAFP